MTDIREKLFADLDASLGVVEIKYDPDHQTPNTPDLEIVASNDPEEQAEELENGNENSGDESAKIAALNDRFRQTHSTEDDEIKGEWMIGDDINALPAPTKAAIKRKVAEFADFEDCPLHDCGAFPHISKNKVHSVIWQIGMFTDETKTALAEHPADPQRSYRVIVVTLSDDKKEDGA
ncbi:DUF3768 domain-containing protein [uncultured Roseibium sp.]|uniref:DUF3768 domain-containing protein n=1 Tax=uncultured Roseibium sp. TaxID=1936171 RepID=UPI00260318A1|nr:DUF3768 domain-containing protein [uncultured Roseibium sp.]